MHYFHFLLRLTFAPTYTYTYTHARRDTDTVMWGERGAVLLCRLCFIFFFRSLYFQNKCRMPLVLVLLTYGKSENLILCFCRREFSPPLRTTSEKKMRKVPQRATNFTLRTSSSLRVASSVLSLSLGSPSCECICVCVISCRCVVVVVVALARKRVFLPAPC